MSRITYLTIALLSITIISKAQMSNTLYFMERIPQSQILNPAIQPKSNIYIGMPGAASYQFNIGNSSLSLSSVFQKGPNGNLILFMNENADKSLFFNDLKDQNNIFNNFQSELLSFGFRVKSWYFNAGVSLKGDITASFSEDFAKLIINGYSLGDRFDLRDNGFNSSLYGELAFGASKILNDSWTVGAKIKFLRGISNFTSKSNKLSFESIDDVNRINQLIFDADITFDATIPFVESVPDGDDLSLDSAFQMKDDPLSGFKVFDNLGFAADIGVVYKGFDKISLSASVLDLGYIGWNSNSINYNLKLDKYSFGGLELDMDSMNIDASQIMDSITDKFTLTKSSHSYSTGLPVKFYLSAEYSPLKFLSFGALSLTQYYREKYYQQFMISANLRPLQMMMFSFSYSFLDNGFSNLGFGTSLRLGPTQFYFISDNIPFVYSSGIPLPHKARYMSFRLGFNWVFGCNEKKKEKDKALNYD